MPILSTPAVNAGCEMSGTPFQMQIMEGDVIRTIRENILYSGHFHTGGNPGRNEIDDPQELQYRTIAKAISRPSSRRVGCLSQPLSYVRGSDRSRERKRAVFIRRTLPRGRWTRPGWSDPCEHRVMAIPVRAFVPARC
jgi:hypothetical protein